MNLRHPIKSWISRWWEAQVNVINDVMAKIDIEPVVIRNKRDLWVTWARIAAGVALAVALFYLALAHGGNTP